MAVGAARVMAPANPLAPMEPHRRWLEWNIRRLQAATDGAPFAEPPPPLPSAANANAAG